METEGVTVPIQVFPQSHTGLNDTAIFIDGLRDVKIDKEICEHDKEV
jgi:hypothetical protein